MQFRPELERGSVIPAYIETAGDLGALVILGQTRESLVVDFKKTIDGWNARKDGARRNAQKETSRDIAQFANTAGGCLLVGVEEIHDSTTGLKVAAAIVPLSQPEAMVQWIEQAIGNFLVPSTIARNLRLVPVRGGNILAVNVAPSLHLVAMWDRHDHAIEYLRRTSHGKEWMNPDEVERHIMNGSRAGKLALQSAYDAVPSHEAVFSDGLYGQEFVGAAAGVISPASVTVSEIGDYTFVVTVGFGTGRGPALVTVPYDLLRAAWSDGERINLLLSARVIIRGGRPVLTTI
jgi:hypothetical protein